MEGSKCSALLPVINSTVLFRHSPAPGGAGPESRANTACLSAVGAKVSQNGLFGVWFFFKLFIKIPAEEVCIGGSPISFFLCCTEECSHNWSIKGGVKMLLIVRGN